MTNFTTAWRSWRLLLPSVSFFTAKPALRRYADGVTSKGWCREKQMTMKNEKRAGDDRRQKEVGPPNGWRERRRSVERRVPEVREIPFSEWLAHLPSKELETAS